MNVRRNTLQKGIILSTLRGMDSHPTTGELYEIIHAAYPTISRSTVYRVLGQMAAEGRVLRVTLAGSDDRFDGNTCPHNHIRCRRCGAVADVPWVAVPPPAHTAGYTDTCCTVEYAGLCPACQKAEKIS